MRQKKTSAVHAVIEIARDFESVEAEFIRVNMPKYLSEIGLGSEYPYLPLYWSESSRHPYVIREAGVLVGFALVRHDSVSKEWELAEFWVEQSNRGLGIASSSARALFRCHGGLWRVTALLGNLDAQAFWLKVLGAPVSRDTEMTLWRFISDQGLPSHIGGS